MYVNVWIGDTCDACNTCKMIHVKDEMKFHGILTNLFKFVYYTRKPTEYIQINQSPIINYFIIISSDRKFYD